MPKQNLRHPKFRCNVCKEYHSAPEHLVMYQCPVHGYLCEKHIITENKEIEIILVSGNKKTKDERRVSKFPSKYFGFCYIGQPHFHIFVGDFQKSGVFYGLNKESNNINLVERFLDRYSCKKTTRYDWSVDNNIWVEEGILPSSIKKSSVSKTNSSIKLLIELFEKDTISKDEFLKLLKEQC
jgi:hypothetical protein